MTKTLQLIADICADLNGNGFCSSPRIVDPATFDLSSFSKQESGLEGLEFEYVDQRSGGGMSGDDHFGTMAYPVENMLLVIDYHS